MTEKDHITIYRPKKNAPGDNTQLSNKRMEIQDFEGVGQVRSMRSLLKRDDSRVEARDSRNQNATSISMHGHGGRYQRCTLKTCITLGSIARSDCSCSLHDIPVVWTHRRAPECKWKETRELIGHPKTSRTWFRADISPPMTRWYR